MADLELFASSPGTGKTYRCIQLFRDAVLESRGGIDSRSFFVLPSREHAERIQNLILGRTVPGLFNAHILTINDLAARFFSSSVGQTPSDVARRSVVRRILTSESGGKLPYFEKVKDCEGFYDLLTGAVKEFKSGLLSIRQFERLCQPLLRDPAFRSKYKSLTVFFKCYEEGLAALGLREPEDLIQELLTHEEAGETAKLVIFDGFYHFTHAQKRLIEWISKRVERMVVTLTVSEGRPALFEHAMRTREYLRSRGFREVEGLMIESHRTSDPALRHLEKQIFLEKPKPFTGTTASVRILEGHSPRGEFEMVGRRIRALCRTQEFFYSDICVILRDLKSYQKVAESVFEDLGIPVFVHERRKLIDQGFVMTLYRLLRLVQEEYRREDLMFILKSNAFTARPPIEDTLALEERASQEGILKGRAEWERLAADPEIPESSRRCVADILSFCEGLVAAPEARPAAASIREWVRQLDTSGEAGADRALAALEAVLQSWCGYYETSSARTFACVPAVAELTESLKAGLFSLRPAGRNRVQVYDAVMALPKEFKVVFLAGLLEKVFPKTVSEDPVLKDLEREVLNREGDVLEPRSVRLSGERYFFYMAFTRAREQVYFSYPLYDAEGRPSLPSFFVEEVRKCLPAVSVDRADLAGFLPPPQMWESAYEASRGLAAALSGYLEGRAVTIPPVLSAAIRREVRDRSLGEALRTAWTGESSGFTDPRVLQSFREYDRPFSPTSLETYATCAFRYFGDKVLTLKDPVEAREAAEMGTVMHYALEKFYSEASKDFFSARAFLSDDASARDVLQKKLEEGFERSALRSLPAYRRQVCLSSMRRTLAVFWESEKKWFAESTGRPLYFEQGFGMGDGDATPPLKIASPAGEVVVRGRIDRIDRLDERGLALVIDYKSSKRTMTLSKRLEKGIELQLPIYLMVAERLLGLEPVGAELRILRKPEQDGLYRDDAGSGMGAARHRKARSPETFRQVVTEAEARIAELAGRLRSGDISIRSKSCEHCDLASLCRFEPWKLIYQTSGVSEEEA